LLHSTMWRRPSSSLLAVHTDQAMAHSITASLTPGVKLSSSSSSPHHRHPKDHKCGPTALTGGSCTLPGNEAPDRGPKSPLSCTLPVALHDDLVAASPAVAYAISMAPLPVALRAILHLPEPTLTTALVCRNDYY
jgi:hypothetical protein